MVSKSVECDIFPSMLQCFDTVGWATGVCLRPYSFPVVYGKLNHIPNPNRKPNPDPNPNPRHNCNPTGPTVITDPQIGPTDPQIVTVLIRPADQLHSAFCCVRRKLRYLGSLNQRMASA